MKKSLASLLLVLSMSIFLISCDDDNEVTGVSEDGGITVTNKTTGKTYNFEHNPSYGPFGSFFSFFANLAKNSDDYIDMQIDDPEEDGDISDRAESGGNDSITIQAEGENYSLGSTPATYEFNGKGSDTRGEINFTTDDNEEIQVEIK